jgi:hypothetical protein
MRTSFNCFAARGPGNVMQWVMASVMIIACGGCHHVSVRHTRIGPSLTSLPDYCRVKIYMKGKPDGKSVPVGWVEVAITKHFGRGVPTMLDALSMLKARVCRLGANAVVGLKERHSNQGEYETIVLRGLALWVLHPAPKPKSADGPGFTKLLEGLRLRRRHILRCTRGREVSLLLWTDGKGLFRKVEVLYPPNAPPALKDCVFGEVRHVRVLGALPYRFFPLMVMPVVSRGQSGSF